MRGSKVLLALALTAATAAHSSKPWKRALMNLDSAPQHAIPVSADSCSTCTSIVSVLQAVANSTTYQQILVDLLDGECSTLFPGQNSSIALCDSIAKAAVSLIPWLDKQMETLAWDIPQTFCSVFVPVCTNPCCADATAPEQLHLSPTGSDVSEMRITWVTLNDTATSTVQWGPATSDPTSLPNSAAGTTRTYTFGGWLGVIHLATMTGLEAGATYTYRVGDSEGGWSQAYNFTVFPANIGTTDRPLRVAQIGDAAYDVNSDVTFQTLAQLAESGDIDAVMHVGDISYADGEQPHWDIYMRKIEPIAARVPYFTTAGNHEIWANFTAYKTRFSMPQEDAFQSMYYSFNVGTVAFVMINTESPIDTANIDAPQVAWLQNTLSAVDRTATPWIIAGGHRPFYCSNNDKTQCELFTAILRMQAEEVLHQYGVDLVITAHEHGYERLWPTYNNTITATNYNNPTAATHIINGAAGNREGNERPSGSQPWSAFQSAEIGYGIFVVSGASSLQYTFYAANGTTIDAINIVKNATATA